MLKMDLDGRLRGYEAIQRICGCRRRRVEVEHFADQHRPANMRDDESHSPAHLVIDEALLVAAKNTEQRKAGRRFIEGGRKVIRPALRSCPLLVDARFDEFGIWHAIVDAVDLSDIKPKLAGRNRIDPDIFLKVTWSRGV